MERFCGSVSGSTDRGERRRCPRRTKETARRLWNVWQSRELDQLDDLIAENHVNHDPNNPSDLLGVEGYRELITMYTTIFADLWFDIHEIIVQSDVVSTRWTARGTHTGEALGLAPTNVAVTRTAPSWQRVENGKIVDTWVERDGLGLARDLRHRAVRVRLSSKQTSPSCPLKGLFDVKMRDWPSSVEITALEMFRVPANARNLVHR